MSLKSGKEIKRMKTDNNKNQYRLWLHSGFTPKKPLLSASKFYRPTAIGQAA